jgi:hypothetical protein
VLAYLRRRGISGPWTLDLSHPGPFPGAVVIPALAEFASLPPLLASLCADHTLPASGLVVVFVVNNRDDASDLEKQDNQRTLVHLRTIRDRLAFPLGIVDAASPAFSLPHKDGGVGMARKIGHDLVLPYLAAATDPVLISLDADTLVEPGYARAVVNHFQSAVAGGAVIPYVHQPGASPREDEAIIRYELFLRCYVAGLIHAASPYGFHTVGSAMACRVSAYLKCGGMNRRRAGEDFYFLQSLAKTSGVQPLAGTVVHPSPRRSGRVPFGTGRAVGAQLDGNGEAVLFHDADSFRLLQRWLALAAAGCRLRQQDLLERAGELSPHLGTFLRSQGFASAWTGFLVQHRHAERLKNAFDHWFDAFRTMKFFHFLADGPLPRRPAEEVVSTWPEVWGGAGLTLQERLTLLRQGQNGQIVR